VARKLNVKHRANEFALSRLGHRLSRKTKKKKVRRPVDPAGNDVFSEWGTAWRGDNEDVTRYCILLEGRETKRANEPVGILAENSLYSGAR
jgi:hypothetical protein